MSCRNGDLNEDGREKEGAGGNEESETAAYVGDGQAIPAKIRRRAVSMV